MRNYHAPRGKVAAALIALGGALLPSAGALAQTAAPAPAPAPVAGTLSTAPVQKPLSIKLGVFFPTSGHAEKVGNDVQFSGGLAYALTKTQQRSPVVPSIYFDYEGGARDRGYTNVYA